MKMIDNLLAVVFVHGKFRYFGVFGVATSGFDVNNDKVHAYEVRKKRGSEIL